MPRSNGQRGRKLPDDAIGGVGLAWRPTQVRRLYKSTMIIATYLGLTVVFLELAPNLARNFKVRNFLQKIQQLTR